MFSKVWELERFQTAKVTFKVIQGHWQWCHSIGHGDIVKNNKSPYLSNESTDRHDIWRDDANWPPNPIGR